MIYEIDYAKSRNFSVFSLENFRNSGKTLPQLQKKAAVVATMIRSSRQRDPIWMNPFKVFFTCSSCGQTGGFPCVTLDLSSNMRDYMKVRWEILEWNKKPKTIIRFIDLSLVHNLLVQLALKVMVVVYNAHLRMIT